MLDSRRRQMVILSLAAVVVTGGLAGCGSTASNAAAASTATARALDSRFSPGQLRGALLTSINGVIPKAPAASGDFSALVGTGIGKGPSAGGRVTPRECAGSAQTGLNTAALAGSLAAAVTFRVGSDDVSEVIVATGTGTSRSALTAQFAAKCARYTRVAGGKTVRYAVTESMVTGIGKQAAVLNVRSSGGAAGNQWSLSYLGTGFAGAVTVIGPSASRQAVRELAPQAYAFAAKSLG